LIITEASITLGINKKISAGKDRFVGFTKRNSDTTLRKAEGLSRAGAQNMNKMAVEQL
jgi:hypothetical protein